MTAYTIMATRCTEITTLEKDNTLSEVQTLARGLQILELLAEVEDGLSSTELADLLEIDKSSMSRFMSTLEKYRFVERNEQSRRYYLGTYVRELGRRAGQHTSLRELAEPHLQHLGGQTRENAHVSVYSAPQALTIADVPSTEPLRVISEVGRRAPMHCSAIGKCLLAFSEISMPETFTRYTERTITDLEQLLQELEQIRLQGYSLDDEELTLGVRGLAVPIRNREGRTIATMGLSGPSVRMTYEKIPELVAFLMEAANNVSSELGFRPAQD